MAEKKPAKPRQPRRPKADVPAGSNQAAPARKPRSRQAAPTSPAPTASVPETVQPKQQLGDTPVAPWAMPSPADKASAEPVKEALDDALEQVTSPQAADRV